MIAAKFEDVCTFLFELKILLQYDGVLIFMLIWLYKIFDVFS